MSIQWQLRLLRDGVLPISMQIHFDALPCSIRSCLYINSCKPAVLLWWWFEILLVYLEVDWKWYTPVQLLVGGRAVLSGTTGPPVELTYLTYLLLEISVGTYNVRACGWKVGFSKTCVLLASFVLGYEWYLVRAPQRLTLEWMECWQLLRSVAAQRIAWGSRVQWIPTSDLPSILTGLPGLFIGFFWVCLIRMFHLYVFADVGSVAMTSIASCPLGDTSLEFALCLPKQKNQRLFCHAAWFSIAFDMMVLAFILLGLGWLHLNLRLAMLDFRSQ